MRVVVICLSVCVLAGAAGAQSLQFQPTTTLTAETANNTSAADSFTGGVSGNAAAGNVSKLPLRSLLYQGSTTKIYAHFMPWFGRSSHVSVGYRSDDPAQVERQVTDMLSRGIGGAIVDWYGPNYPVENNSTIALRDEAERRSEVFEFAVMLDAGSLNSCANTAGCDITQRVIDYLNYAYTTFENSPRYMRIGSRPVVFFFGTEAFAIDWTRVRAGVSGNPLFVFRNIGAFTKTYSDGGFSWLKINTTNPDDEGLAYLDEFYTTAKNYPAEHTFGSGYPGFDDTLAPWRTNAPRSIKQHCGQAWLNTWSRAGRFYSSSAQLPALQIVTWNDYEEGTSIESGIDNCVQLSAAVSGSQLTWSIGGAGNESAVHHYRVFLSTDGEQLMPVGEVAAGTHSFDLASLGLDPAVTYTIFVQAIGQPTIVNRMSGAVTYRPPTSNQNQVPVAQLTVSPSSGTAPVSVTASTSGSSDPDGTIVASSINFGDGFSAAGTTATHTYSTAGTYTVTATVTDDDGATATATRTVTVSAAVATVCTGSTANRTVTVCAPTAGSTVAAPVRVVATATDSAAVTSMQVYLDGAKLFEKANTKTIDTFIPATPGKHRLVVQARDSKGSFKQTVNFTVR